MHFILASRSPRRHDLLTLYGIPFEVMAVDIDETQRPGEAPREYVQRLSREKAHAVASVREAWVLGADTIVVYKGQVLGKPREATEARHTLRRLRGNTHHVMTAVSLLHTPRQHTWTELASSPVTMRHYTDDEIEAYIATGDPFDKAGSYAIQHPVFAPAAAFDHCFANVMGLPLCHIKRLFEAADLTTHVDIAATCQHHIVYQCPVFDDILPT